MSFWLDTAGSAPGPRPALRGDAAGEVAIVGGGFTGLWTAYYLAELAPDASIHVVEAAACGSGASGRNGGWASADFAAGRAALDAAGGPGAAAALEAHLRDAVDEIGRVCRAEGIDAHYAKGGALTLAAGPGQADKLAALLDAERAAGVGASDLAWLDGPELAARVRSPAVAAALYTPHCAAVHPGRLVRGLARAVEQRGVQIWESTPATAISPGLVETPGGRVRARVVLVGLEAYNAALAGRRRDLAPLWSFMIATAPLPERFWREVGLAEREVFADGRRALLYGQRTADGRLAVGGRGVAYRFGSRLVEPARARAAIAARLHEALVELFGHAARPAELAPERVWRGALGVPRDWFPAVRYDAGRGLGWAGGYVGDGVSASNLAGRTLAELVLGRRSERAGLAWVGACSPPWPPEP
ncbi:MAG: NAD(P)/FAD-dependent oxidoreductase, partial [Acidimicrobiales bacterium]